MMAVEKPGPSCFFLPFLSCNHYDLHEFFFNFFFVKYTVDWEALLFFCSFFRNFLLFGGGGNHRTDAVRTMI